MFQGWTCIFLKDASKVDIMIGISHIGEDKKVPPRCVVKPVILTSLMWRGKNGLSVHHPGHGF